MFDYVWFPYPISILTWSSFSLFPQEGEIKLSDYDYIIAHPSVITDLVPIRGLLKRRFPTIRTGTLDPNLGELVKKFAAGVQYKVIKDENQESLGKASVPVGRVRYYVLLIIKGQPEKYLWTIKAKKTSVWYDSSEPPP